MISKKTFIETIAFIKKLSEQEDKLCSILEEMSGNTCVESFIYSDSIAQLLKLLNEGLEVGDDDTLLYFIYDLEFGKKYKDGCFEVNDEVIDISTAEKLYDYFCSNK